MGQAKNYRTRFFRSHPICCFCGGKSVAEEIEHIPPRIMFLKKHRPSGFEFPTCVRFNRASRKSDTLVSFLSKFVSYNDYATEHRSDFKKESMAALMHCPESFNEIMEGRIGHRRAEREINRNFGGDAVLSTVGKKQREHINLFAVKLCVATYYQESIKIASENAKIFIWVYTQASDLDKSIPSLLNHIGQFKTLQQGSWSVENQFAYRFQLTENKLAGVFEFWFHQNLRLVTFIFDDPLLENDLENEPNAFSIRDIDAVEDKKRNPYPTISHGFSIP